MSSKSILIGIGGGTGSGKTLVSQRIFKELGSDRVTIIEQDSYYRDLVDVPFDSREERNFDHPNAFDIELMRQQIAEMVDGMPVDVPIYDYTTHTRKAERRRVENHFVIILEGILVLFDPGLRSMMDIKAYIDTDADIRFIRRLNRDLLERKRSLTSIIKQYEASVRPMHQQFVEPTRSYADIIIPGGGYNEVAIDLFKTKIATLIAEREEKPKKRGKK